MDINNIGTSLGDKQLISEGISTMKTSIPDFSSIRRTSLMDQQKGKIRRDWFSSADEVICHHCSDSKQVTQCVHYLKAGISMGGDLFESDIAK